jgi:4-amino-4-deoxy-L-arabinose transferase-like glycosyltransferase
MIVTLPLLSFVFIMLYFVAHGSSYRKAFLLAAISCGLLLTAATEILSLFCLINYLSLSIYWGVITVAAMISFYHNKSAVKFRKPQFGNILPIAGVGTIIILTLLTAIISPPNNWDSMTYHMSRVMHWIQNESVAHYPTAITRQLYLAPWAEYAIMHLQILRGGDYFANLVQWFAMCGSIIGVTLIAKEFGASGYIQAFAAVIVATIPMGILQASSTQNDYVVSFWLVCFVYFGLFLIREQKWINTLTVGSSLGLAVLTKGTAYIFAFPFVVWFLYAGIKVHGWNLLKYLSIITVIIIALNAGHYQRNYALWGNPITTDEDKLTNEHVTMKGFISNLTRNIVTHTWTHVESMNMLQYRGVEMVHDFMGHDMNDPATTHSSKGFSKRRISWHEDYAGNGVHLLLVFLIISAIVSYGRRLSSSTKLYCMALVGGFFLFSALLKWVAFGSRYQLPFFVLASPLAAVALPYANRKWFLNSVMTALLLCSLPSLFLNDTRPFLREWSILSEDRETLYFVSRPELKSQYLGAVNDLKNMGSCKDIGLIASVDGYEYPFWALACKHMEQLPRIEHINVNNISGTIPIHDFTPCAAFRLM